VTLVPVCLSADAREARSYERLLGSRRAQLLLTDPPYCLLTRRRAKGDEREPKGRKIDRDPLTRFETVRDYRAFTDAWFPNALARLGPDAVAVVWTNFLGKEPLTSVARTCGYSHVAGEFVWAKRSKEGGGNELLLRVYEVALVFQREAPRQGGVEAKPTVWSVVAGYDDEGEASRWGNHPNHKPFGVLDPLVRTYSKPGDLVLDCFAGSGSIPAAVTKLGRAVACMELRPEWAERVTQRLGQG
jgi:site-specific DNA-methyltransferase (adenine-specific)